MNTPDTVYWFNMLFIIVFKINMLAKFCWKTLNAQNIEGKRIILRAWWRTIKVLFSICGTCRILNYNKKANLPTQEILHIILYTLTSKANDNIMNSNLNLKTIYIKNYLIFVSLHRSAKFSLSWDTKELINIVCVYVCITIRGGNIDLIRL